MQKLTIVVNCTDRKSVAPEADLRIRSIPAGALSERFAQWRGRLDRADARVELLNLYQGDAWLQAKALATDARESGYSVRMLVASAGLGLRDITTSAPSYAATFASGHHDSVSDVATMSTWWNHLADLPDTVSVQKLKNESVLLVLSENYARAMNADLTEMARGSGEKLLVGGWRDIDGMPRLPANRDLRNALGGTVSTVSLRMARRWIVKRSTSDLFASSDLTRWKRWARTAERPEVYERIPMDDNEIIKYIRLLLRQDPSLSATRALRLMRDQGIACEQKRFGALFRTTKGQR